MAYPVLAAQKTWYKGSAAISTITQVNIVDSYTPTGSESQSWFADVGNSGLIKCYINGTTLTIAGNGSGKIACNVDSSNMFNGFGALRTIVGIDLLDTIGVTTFERAFQQCYALESVDLSNWVTSTTTSIKAMFQGCKSISNIDTTNWNTCNITDMSYFLNGGSSTYTNYKLMSLDVSNWDVSKVTSMQNMFRLCAALESLDMTKWNPISCTSFNAMFHGCSSLTNLDISNWQTASVTNTTNMFYSCSNLQTIKVSTMWDMSNVSSSSNMFHGCTSLVGGAGTTFDSTKAVDATYARIDGGIQSGYLTLVKQDILTDNYSMWKIADAIRGVTGENKKYKINSIQGVLLSYRPDVTPQLAPRDAWYRSASMNKSDITAVHFVNSYTATGNEDESWAADLFCSGSVMCYRTGTELSIVSSNNSFIMLNTDCSKMFCDMTSLVNITGTNLLNFSGVTTLESAFYNDVLLTSIDLSSCVLSNVTNTDLMFANCHAISTIDLGVGLSAIGTKMFHRCLALTKITGLSQITAIGDMAFIYTPLINQVDIVPSKITNIGVRACRFSSIEDNLDLSSVPEDSVGESATRFKRWGTHELDPSIPNASVLKTIPNADSQLKYYNIPFATNDSGLYDVATSACMSLAFYHLCNASLGEANAYTSWKQWWDTAVEPQYRADMNNQNAVYAGENYHMVLSDYTRQLTASGLSLATVNSGYNPTKITDSSHKSILVEYLNTEGTLPIWIGINSPNRLDDLNITHSMLIIGYDSNTNKFAICDSAVRSDVGVVAWLSFEDIFASKTINTDIKSNQYYFVESSGGSGSSGGGNSSAGGGN